MESKEKSLGKKIEFYRKRAKLSQLELELEIDAAQGSISRIENGQVNPTKETIRKIIDVLDLNIIEAAELYELSIEDISKIVRLAGKLNSNLDMDIMLDNAVNSIARDLDLSGVCILLVENGYLRVRALDDLPGDPTLVSRIIGGPTTRLKISLDSTSKNIILRSVKENTVLSSFDAYDFTRDVLPKSITNLIVRFTYFESGIVFPLSYDSEIIGAVMFMKSAREDFTREFEILKAFTENLSLAVINIKKYEMLKTSSSNGDK